jgi:hypothetical protein
VISRHVSFFGYGLGSSPDPHLQSQVRAKRYQYPPSPRLEVPKCPSVQTSNCRRRPPLLFPWQPSHWSPVQVEQSMGGPLGNIKNTQVTMIFVPSAKSHHIGTYAVRQNWLGGDYFPLTWPGVK